MKTFKLWVTALLDVDDDMPSDKFMKIVKEHFENENMFEDILGVENVRELQCDEIYNYYESEE